MRVLVFDTEVSTNYFLFAAMDIDSGGVIFIEKFNDSEFDKNTFKKIVSGNLSVGFNSNSYDLLMLSAAIAGFSNARLCELSNEIIYSKLPPWRISDRFGLKPIQFNHIDVIDVAPGIASLKMYGCRMGVESIRDMPFTPGVSVNDADRQQIRDYCYNDLLITKQLYSTLLPKIDLREKIGAVIGIDARSKSDAQIAEKYLLSELLKANVRVSRPDGKRQSVNYSIPKFIKFRGNLMNNVLDTIRELNFETLPSGGLQLPKSLSEVAIGPNGTKYKMGIGGLHSMENNRIIENKPGFVLRDYDVVSYYPNIILNCELYPTSLGEKFLTIYKKLLTERVNAKHAGDIIKNETLKIVLNASFGKLANKYSSLYSPKLFLQVVLTGQLSLLMLIEMLESHGIDVVSANTDGIVVFTDKVKLLEKITADWEKHTRFELEANDYKILVSNNVNNYFAIKNDGSVKTKGCYAPRGLSKNPDCAIIFDSIIEYHKNGTPVEKTIRECTDMGRFIIAKKVTGGAEFRGEYLGRAVRYYWSTAVGMDESIKYAKNSNRVGKSAGAMPIQTLPTDLPNDIDHTRYIAAANKIICKFDRI